MKLTEEEVDRRAREQQDGFLACLITAQSALWSALLSANGIVIGVLSLLAAIRSPSLPQWILALFVGALLITSIAMLAVLWCFRIERDHHQLMLDWTMEPVPQQEELTRRRGSETERISRIHTIRQWLERLATASILVDLAVIAVIVMFGGFNN